MAVKVLVIGGTGFIGPHVVRQLSEVGHSVAVFHRGKTKIDLPAEHILGDRSELVAMRPKADVVVDLILSSGAQAQAIMDTFRGIARRVVAASSCDVYRACGVLHGSEEGPLQPVPLKEDSERCGPSFRPIRAREWRSSARWRRGWTIPTIRSRWNARSWETLVYPVPSFACP